MPPINVLIKTITGRDRAMVAKRWAGVESTFQDIL